MTGLPSWRRDRRKTAERGYGGRWQKERQEYLRLHPLCGMCLPRAVQATVVDHKVPHRGDLALFWDRSNWQSLCANHHSSDKQMLEKSGRARQTIGPDGEPVRVPGG